MLAIHRRPHQHGNPVDIAGMIIYRLEGGQIVESWGQNDMLGMLEQLGLA